MKFDTALCPVDAHVHLHALERVAPALDAALRNFRQAGGPPRQVLGVLLLAQSSGERVFESLVEMPAAGRWRLSPVSAEPESLVARTDDTVVGIVCGRQVRAKDGLEILALGTRQTYPDGLPFDEALQAVLASGALTVIPWGFGKWLGERGRRVSAALDLHGPRALFLGDNGSRLAAAGLPPLLRSAARRGYRILPGTDPFPFASGFCRVGEFGFLAGIEPSMDHPWRDLRRWVEGLDASPASFGRAMGVPAFVFNQVGIQIYNRLWRAPRP